jgi:beta-lactamase class A
MNTPSRSNVRPILAAVAVVAWLLWSTSSARADDAAFEEAIRSLIRAHRGKVTVAIKPLAGGAGLYLDADEEMPTASLIKFMVMLEAYQQALEGKIKLDTPVTLRKEDRVPGSGILTYHFSDGATFPLRDAVRLMIVFSDNTATNLVLDQIGIASTGARMKEWGCSKTKIHAKVFRGDTTSIDKEGSKRFGLGVTTARETVTLLEKLHRQEVATPALCKEMLGHLKKCEDRTKLKRLLPAEIEVAHKTGSVTDVKTDAGILYLKSGPVAVCVLTRGNEDKRFHDDNAANILIGKIGKAVADHFGAK